MKALSVLSVGTLGLTTQAGGDLDSIFLGPLGTLKVAGDVRGASLLIAGNVGALTIGGSLVGGVSTLVNSTSTLLGDLSAGKPPQFPFAVLGNCLT